MNKFTDDIISEHYARYKSDGQVTTARDYIDAYYAEQQRQDTANGIIMKSMSSLTYVCGDHMV